MLRLIFQVRKEKDEVTDEVTQRSVTAGSFSQLRFKNKGRLEPRNRK